MAPKLLSISVGTLLCATLVAAPGSTYAASEAPGAQILHKEGLAAFKEGRFLEAGETFLLAYQRDPSASLLWNAARSFDKGGATTQAREAYSRYVIAEGAKAEKVARARAWLQAHPEPEIKAPPQGSSHARAETTLVRRAAKVRAQPNKAAGWTLISLGAAGFAGASVAMILAASSRDETETLQWGADYEATLSRHRELTATTEARELAAWITYGAALGLVTSGLVVLLAPPEATSEVGLKGVGFSPLAGGGHAQATWQF